MDLLGCLCKERVPIANDDTLRVLILQQIKLYHITAWTDTELSVSSFCLTVSA